MTDLRAVMDGVAGASEDVGLYDDLAPLYEFVYDRHYDYGEIAAWVRDHAPDGAERALVGACGTGGTLARLAETYDATGVDRARGMLDRAAARTDAPLARADLTEAAFPGHDVYTVVGNSLAHLTSDAAVDALFARARESLAPGGRLLLDFLPAAAFEDGRVSEDRFAGERFAVDRTVVSVTEARGPRGVDATFAFAYAITDEERGETVRVGESMPTRAHDAASLREAALAAGFDEAEAVDPPAHHGGALVARR